LVDIYTTSSGKAQGKETQVAMQVKEKECHDIYVAQAKQPALLQTQDTPYLLGIDKSTCG